MVPGGVPARRVWNSVVTTVFHNLRARQPAPVLRTHTQHTRKCHFVYNWLVCPHGWCGTYWSPLCSTAPVNRRRRQL